MKSLLRRYSAFIIVSIVLALLFALLAWFGLKEGQRVALKLMERDARSLSGILISGCQKLFQAGIFIEKEIGQGLKQQLQLLDLDAESGKLDEIAQRGGFSWIIIIDPEGNILHQSYCSYPSPQELLSGIPRDLLPLLEGERQEMFFGIDPEFPFLSQPKGYAYREGDRIVVVFAREAVFEKAEQLTGIGHLIQDMAQEPSVKYLLLQNEDGIMFASQRVRKMPKISQDDFLIGILRGNPARGRFTRFEGEDVYEYTRQFPPMGDFRGVLRMGFSLNEYNIILNTYKWELMFFIILLFVIASVSVSLILTSKRFQAAQKLSDSILSNMDAVCLAVDRRGRISRLNRAGESFWGWVEEEVKGKEYMNLFTGDELNVQQTLLNQRSCYSAQKEIQTTQGKRMVNLCTTYLGKEGAFAIIEDITDIIRLKEEVASQEYLKTLSDLIASVAHEVRNPLNAISIASQRLSSEFEVLYNDREAVSLLRTIHQEVLRVDKLVREFISLTSPVSPEKKLQPVQPLIDDLTKLAGLEADAAKVKLETQTEPELEFYFDYEKLKKALYNLLKNAIEATPPGGKVRFSAKMDKDGLFISVWDDGKAIGKDQLERIFKPFVSFREKGTGLGLFVVHQTVKEHGGKVSVESNENFTEFKVFLPGRG
ncbi:PAS domain S-box protein [bacterium]|nr:PAS domain S-box protein [bacterium]